MDGITLSATSVMAVAGCAVLLGLITVILVARRPGGLPRSGRGHGYQSGGSDGYTETSGYSGGDSGGGDSGGSSGGGDGGGDGGSF